MKRQEILEEAIRCTCGDREGEYGSPEDNFTLIAKLWSEYKDVEFTAVDIAMMMSLLKIARIKTGNATDDSFVDLAGYAACGGEISARGKRPPTDMLKYCMDDAIATNALYNAMKSDTMKFAKEEPINLVINKKENDQK